MAHLRFGDEFNNEDLVALFDSIEIAELESGHHPPDALTRELIDVMQARGIGDHEELASMLVQLDDRARPSRPKPFRPGTMLDPNLPRVTVVKAATPSVRELTVEDIKAGRGQYASYSRDGGQQ